MKFSAVRLDAKPICTVVLVEVKEEVAPVNAAFDEVADAADSVIDEVLAVKDPLPVSKEEDA